MVVDQLSLGLGRLRKHSPTCLQIARIIFSLDVELLYTCNTVCLFIKTIFTVVREVKRAKVCFCVHNAIEMSHDLYDNVA